MVEKNHNDTVVTLFIANAKKFVALHFVEKDFKMLSLTYTQSYSLQQNLNKLLSPIINWADTIIPNTNHLLVEALLIKYCIILVYC